MKRLVIQLTASISTVIFFAYMAFSTYLIKYHANDIPSKTFKTNLAIAAIPTFASFIFLIIIFFKHFWHAIYGKKWTEFQNSRIAGVTISKDVRRSLVMRIWIFAIFYISGGILFFNIIAFFLRYIGILEKLDLFA